VSGLGERLLQEVTSGAGAAPLGSWVEQVAELVRGWGSERKAAEGTPFSRSTFYRWKKGAKPRRGTLDKLAAEVRKTRVDPAYPRDKAITIDVTEWRSDPSRDGSSRTLHGGRGTGGLNLRPGTMRRVADAYVRTGDPEVMARVFVAGVSVGFYRNALGAGLDPGGPSGPVDVPDDEDGDDLGDDEDAIYDLYEDYDGPDDGPDDVLVGDLAYEGDDVPVPDADSYGFDVA